MKNKYLINIYFIKIGIYFQMEKEINIKYLVKRLILFINEKYVCLNR